jgi:hypothetical protein
VKARVVEETEMCVGLYAMPDLCSYLIATTFAIRLTIRPGVAG